VSTKGMTDAAIGATASGAGLAVWMEWIQGGAATVAAVGGALLVLVRLWVAVRDLRRPK
jgi:hypothetical protein